MSNQITEVRLLTVPLENDYKHTLHFDTISSQTTYFLGKTKFSGTNFSYQRKEGYISFPEHCDNLRGCNYLMYKNSNKWYYAFITEMIYKSDEVTWIYFETDVIQTYLFDYTVKASFVEREHVNDDTIGAHTFPENLEIGEYICEYRQQVSELSDISYVMGITETDSDAGSEIAPGWGGVVGTTYDGIFSGIRYMAFTPTEVNRLITTMIHYSEEGKNEAIKCLFMYPTPFIQKDEYNHLIGSTAPKEITHRFTKNQSYTGYKPVNKKLYCFPYQYLLVSNNNGASAVYHFESFSDPNNTVFSIKGCITPGGSIRLTPKSYKGVALFDEEGLNLGKYPICNWTSDEYTNWLTQNSVNIGLNIATGIGQVVAGTALAVGTGGVGAAVGGGQIVGGVSTIANQLAQVHQMSFTPAQSRGNINCGDVITASASNTFFFHQMRIKNEYLKIIDNYFSMFGYKCNQVKTPLKNHRSNYWYTKTIDVSIDGAIPNKDMQTIKNCYNNGITFWRDPNNIGDYSVNNVII